MTLYRQLVFFTLFLFILLFAGTWFAKLESTRSFLQNQLISHAQDTATSLGLSLSQFMSHDDLPAAETMINAVFDRGYYRVVRLEDINQSVLIEKISDVTIESVPQWFINVVALDTPEAEALVMSGWRQSGLVYIKSHPGYAYKALWESVVRMSFWFFFIALLVILVGGYGLRLLLRPLQMVEQQADAVCRKEYEIQENIPRTRELRRVVKAMNRMIHTVRKMFSEQASLAESLQRKAYLDHLTGLGNRRYFEGQIAASLTQDESKIHGALLLCQLNNLQALNNERGLEAGDNLLKHTAQILNDSTKTIQARALARLTGGDFAVLLPHITPEVAARTGEEVMKGLTGLFSQKLTVTDNVAHIGIVLYDRSASIGLLLSQADNALRSAQKKGANKIFLKEMSSKANNQPIGRQDWKNILQDILDKEQIALYVQPVVDSDDHQRILHQEVFSRIKLKSGEILNAGVFIPEAERNGIISLLDRIVIKKVLQLDRTLLQADKVVVNVSPISLQDPAFNKWLMESLASLPANAPRVVFEFVEFSAVQHLDVVKEFGKLIKQLGHDIGLDHFGQSFSNFGYLQSLRPCHVKIDGAFTAELTVEENDSRFFMRSLCSVAHSLDVAVIAEGLESAEQWDRLKNLNLDALQGYFIGKPKLYKGMNSMGEETP